MKRTSVILAAVLFMCAALLGEEITGLVTRVADGDTLTIVDSANTRHRIRFWGIDSPEKDQSMGRKAGSVLSALVMRKNIRVEVVNRDIYGREVGRVYLGEMYVNLEMIRRGMAWHYVAYAKNASDLRNAELEARARKIGIWSEPDPMPPWLFRKNQRAKRK